MIFEKSLILQILFFSSKITKLVKIYGNVQNIQVLLLQDLYEDVDYGVLTPQTKIKVKVNPSGILIFYII